MKVRPQHPNKEIEAALASLEELKWTYKKPGASAHCWGRMLCPHNDRNGCQVSVWSTPRSPEEHAKALIRAGKRCSH
ncbi:hypothetical protein CN135_32140 [Sinorhizobium meliloti]|nr:hypothetical protein CN212_10450 [Sinorhizobium meliloti]RVL70419.1 hypothetical protein CN135_32140 [Sinorhizobium meliloti]